MKLITGKCFTWKINILKWVLNSRNVFHCLLSFTKKKIKMEKVMKLQDYNLVIL